MENNPLVDLLGELFIFRLYVAHLLWGWTASAECVIYVWIALLSLKGIPILFDESLFEALIKFISVLLNFFTNQILFLLSPVIFLFDEHFLEHLSLYWLLYSNLSLLNQS